MKESELEVKCVTVNIGGDLDGDDCRDRFKIMQNMEGFEYCIFNCLIYLFSEHVNGFFEVNCLVAIIHSSTSLFSNKKEAVVRFEYVLSLFDRFDFIECKLIDDKAHVRSTIDDAGFSDCVRRGNKFSKKFDEILDQCLDIFEKWIAYSEDKEIDKRRDT